VDVYVTTTDEKLPYDIAQALVAKTLASNDVWYIEDDYNACKTVGDLSQDETYVALIMHPALTNRPTPEFRDIPNWRRPLTCGVKESDCDPCIENDGWPTLVAPLKKWGESCTKTDGTTGQCTWNGTCENICEGVTCAAGTTCSMGKCVCPNGEEPCNGTCCAEGYICSNFKNGECVRATGNCTSNHDCTYNQFCNIKGTWADTLQKYTSFQGTCTTASKPRAKMVDLGDESEQMLYASSDKASWWGAKNYCILFGLRTFSIANNRLKCANPNVGNPEAQADGFAGEGCAKPGATFNYSDDTTWSEPFYAICQAFGAGVHGTVTYATDEDWDPQHSIYIHTGYGTIAHNFQYSGKNGNGRVLCE